MTLKHKFVEYIPEDIQKGCLYISISYDTVVHKCCCGCGKEVVTPLSPTDWKLTYNGDSISLFPSIGNWNFECKSHYWITNNQVEWAKQWTEEEIQYGRYQDKLNKTNYYQDNKNHPNDTKSLKDKSDNNSGIKIPCIWNRLKKWFV